MSADEDIELKNLVAQTLENKGVLPKIRAELRANVFLALEENPNTKDTLLRNDELSAFLKVPIGTLVLNLIREFLEFFELEFTLSVFEPETKYGKEYNSITRDKMINELKIADTNKKNPLLFDVIDKVVNINKLEVGKVSKTQKGIKSSSPNGGSDTALCSPVALNTTYVKKSEYDSIISSPVGNEGKDDTNESIKEVLSNDCSEENSSSEVQLALDKISKVGHEQLLSSVANKSNEVNTNTINIAPKETLEIDLLTFTPVKEMKANNQSKTLAVDDNTDKKTDEKKEKPKSTSVLGDLPPLNAQVVEKDFDMKDLKAIMDGWSGTKGSQNTEENDKVKGLKESEDNSSAKLKSASSGKSPKSEAIEVDDFEDNTSDVLSSHTSQDTPNTIDETISRASCAADYLESL